MTPRKDASPFPAGTRACVWCDTVKRFRSGKRYCSPRCAAYGRTMGQTEQAISDQARRASVAAARKRTDAVLARVDGMTAVVAYQLGRKLGFADGYKSGQYRARRDARRVAA